MAGGSTEDRLLELERKVSNLVRVGRVSAVNAAAATVQVAFEEADGLVSADLPVLHRRTSNVMDYAMPAPGEQVLCVFLPVGLETGFVLGSTYSAADAPPTDDATLRVVAGEELRLGSVDAEHPLSHGEKVQDLVRRLLSLLSTMAPIGNLGVPVAFQTDILGTDGTTPGGILAVKAVLEALGGAIDDSVSDTVTTD